jgi:hypothetical protein
MAVDERSRRLLQEALMDAIGPDPTDTLLTYLPPTGWADVATTRDVAGLGTELRAEMASVRIELRAEMASLRTELQAEMNSLRTELRGDMDSLRTELRGEMEIFAATVSKELHSALRVQFYWLVTVLIAVAGMALAVQASGVLR